VTSTFIIYIFLNVIEADSEMCILNSNKDGYREEKSNEERR
jgi:hypothetical protein